MPPTASRRWSPRRTGRRADPGLSKIASACSAPWCISAFERELAAFDESLDERAVACVPLALRARSGAVEQRPQPVESGDERRLIVGAHDTAASRERERLQDARKREPSAASSRGSIAIEIRTKPGDRRAGARGAVHASAACCARRPRRRRVAWQPEPFLHQRDAITVGRSPTARTPSSGRVRASSMIARDRCETRP